MFRPLALYIGLRYTRAKKHNHFVSFISFASMLGLALGVTVLITVLSVMNGFDHEIHNRVFSLTRQITVTDYTGKINNWQDVQHKFDGVKDIIASAPFVAAQGMLTNDGESMGVMVEGIIPEQENQVSEMANYVISGSISELKSRGFGIVLGGSIARHLRVDVGDKVVLITPQISTTPVGLEPRFKQFTVVGIFHVGGGFGHDSTTAFINLYDAQKLFTLDSGITGFNLKIKDLYQAPMITAKLSNKLNEEYLVSDWTHQYGSYFKAIQMEKTTMFVVLLFIIAVAVFNLVSSLVMTVNDKQSDIAILRTLGATPKMVMAVFMVQGGVIGLFGTLLGVLGGVLLAINAPNLILILEKALHTQFISAGIYFIDYLPSKLEFYDVWRVSLVALIMSLLATIYPAWRAAKTQPVEALRYE